MVYLLCPLENQHRRNHSFIQKAARYKIQNSPAYEIILYRLIRSQTGELLWGRQFMKEVGKWVCAWNLYLATGPLCLLFSLLPVCHDVNSLCHTHTPTISKFRLTMGLMESRALGSNHESKVKNSGLKVVHG